MVSVNQLHPALDLLLAWTCSYCQDSNPSACHFWRRKKKSQSLRFRHSRFCSGPSQRHLIERLFEIKKTRGQRSGLKRKFQTNYKISDAELSNSSLLGQSLPEGAWNPKWILIALAGMERVFAAAPRLGAGDPSAIKDRCLSPVHLRTSQRAFL